ncbi:DEAD-box ATP-dependent RNA helicase 50 isoform X2 [Syzygium oleosum]|uniref:DEAD-box ATP-dependent RNA helicase 50 isoform X2 n=1 Tax=Syzygium oleosum TaxID=219896 RepID=UPI0024B92A2C|nr:DEAD-box ATP-dependent RNA helicase 50 isoform X2 [Syzygium oleosum]
MMLAKAPSPPVSLNSTPFSSSSSSSSVAYPFSFRPRLLPSRALGARRLPGGRARHVAVRSGGYTRTPLGTPGAYQLTDDETGERFIVWGGSDDPADAPVPPEDVLRWKPPRKSGGGGGGGGSGSRGRNHHGSTLPKDDSPTASVSGLGRSFGRLKSQRVKALAEKSSKLKQASHKDYESAAENVPFDVPDLSNSKLDQLGKKKKAAILGLGGKDSGAYQSKAANDTAARTDTEDVDHLVRRMEPDKHGISATRVVGTEHSVRSSNADFRGWGRGVSLDDYRSESKDLYLHRKVSSNSDFHSRKSFEDLGCSDFMIESLRKQRFLRPSHIQAMAFKPVIEGKTCIIADQSGSGKTLAYLAPVVQRLRQEELQGLSKSFSQSPRVVILVPTAELASQVLSNCRSISKFGAPFRSMVATGGFRQKTQLENIEEGVDVLIATPGRFIFLVKEGFLELKDLRCVILDEVHILCNDEEFEAAFQSIINSSPVTTQYLFVTATLPVDIYYKIVEILPDCEVIMGPGIHRTSPHLEEFLIDCSGEEDSEKTSDTAFLNKKSALIQLAEESPVTKTIVFCNKIETCRKVENALKRVDRKGARTRVLPFHAAVSQESRQANMKEFAASPSKDVSLFLVCTDRASRGIDFTGVDHVILFDFPRDPSEYVRRVGRTARGAKGKGKAFVFAVGKQVSLARRIMERNRRGHPLHDVPSAYESMR